MRMSSLNNFLSDPTTIVVASVAAIYGALNPQEYKSTFYEIAVGQDLNRQQFYCFAFFKNCYFNLYNFILFEIFKHQYKIVLKSYEVIKP